MINVFGFFCIANFRINIISLVLFQQRYIRNTDKENDFAFS